MIGTISITDEERQANSISRSNLARGSQFFRQNGYLSIQHAFDLSYIKQLQAAYIDYLEFNEDRTEIQNALKVGEKRYMVPISIAGVFNDPRIYANHALLPLFQSLLGRDCVLGSFGSVVSLPGSDAQHQHFDHPALFPENDGLSCSVPSYAVTVGIPLVDITEDNGPTTVFSGSHLQMSEDAYQPESEVHLKGPMSSCYIWDYRLFHGGQPNRSDDIRPLLYFVYCRPWFRDAVNFSTVDPILMPDEEYEKVPKPYRGLLKQVKYKC